jgi:hypothetical protein
MGDNARRHFQYLACSGATAPEILSKQVPKMQKSHLVTLHAGGNDAHLATILNYCVYQWATFWGWSCSGELQSAADEINSQGFSDNLKALLSGIDANLIDDHSRVYWIGYEKFWNADTPACDKVTWSFSGNIGFRQFLTQANR